jgi:hypothetical protein
MESKAEPISRPRGFFKRLDPVELATGIFIFCVAMWSDYVAPGLNEFAQNLVLVTVVSEFFLIWPGGGAVAAARSDSTFNRVACLVIGAGIYAAVVIEFTWDHAHWVVFQSLWILCMRFRPRAGVPMLGREHLLRAGYRSLAGPLTVIGQFILLGLFTAGLQAIGVEMRLVDGATMPPKWVSAVVWGSFYIELGLLAPVFEKLWSKD